jgi:hypothetical protein
MGLASIANVPSDQNSLNEWAFSHQAHHIDVSAWILANKHDALPSFILDPMNPNNLGVWSYQHQMWHNDINSILGTAGQDLTDVDWRDQSQVASWIFEHMIEHLAWNGITGV